MKHTKHTKHTKPTPSLRKLLARLWRAVFARAGRAGSDGLEERKLPRNGWTPLSYDPQARRRSTDAPAWADVRPNGITAPGVRSGGPARIP